MSKTLIIVIVIVALFFIFKQFTGSKDASINIQIGADFLAGNEFKEGVKSTESGLQYKIITVGDGEVHPKATSKVMVHYHGTLLDGSVFDSSVDRGEPISFKLNQVIKGWTEGVQMMVVGDKFRFYIPSRLAYGSRGVGKIPAGSLLIFDVELIKVY